MRSERRYLAPRVAETQRGGALQRAAPPGGAVLVYRYCAAQDLISRVLTEGVARPVVEPDYTATVGLDRDQGPGLGRCRRHRRPGVAYRGGSAAAIGHTLRVNEAAPPIWSIWGAGKNHAMSTAQASTAVTYRLCS
jgi:hypothetical protein